MDKTPMKIKVQTCSSGRGTYRRLMVCGGLRIRSETWDKKTATQALNLLAIELPNIPRKSIKFTHE